MAERRRGRSSSHCFSEGRWNLFSGRDYSDLNTIALNRGICSWSQLNGWTQDSYTRLFSIERWLDMTDPTLNLSVGPDTPGNVVTLRPVSPRDEDFLFKVYAGTRQDELAQLPWDDNQRASFLRMQFDAQQQDYKRRFPDAESRLILLNDRPIGGHYVARNESEIRILEIAILPADRKKGVGTRLIRNLLDEAARTHRLVRVYVERFNPSLDLFERLGFARVDDIGSHFLLEWRGPS